VAARFSETVVSILITIWHHNPQDHNLKQFNYFSTYFKNIEFQTQLVTLAFVMQTSSPTDLVLLMLCLCNECILANGLACRIYA
jgi:hypothetical protein